jgi:NADH pyrophosphatase NudC (nudix superfamily)
MNGEELIARTKIFDVVRKPEAMPGFRPVGINAPNWVMAIVEKDGRFLMTHQIRWGVMEEVEEFVCGAVDACENAIDAVSREVSEETGYIVPKSAIGLLGKVYPNPAFLNNTMTIFHVNLGKCVYVKTESDPGEHEKLTTSWVDKDNVLNPPASEMIAPALKMCAIHLYEKKCKEHE